MTYNFLHTFHPKSIAFFLGPFPVHWYGVFIVLGIFLGMFFVLRFAARFGRTRESVYDVLFYAVLGSIIGARVYAVLLFWSWYKENPLDIIKVWEGGLAIHGAIIGGLLSLILYCMKTRQPFWVWADLFVPFFALGQAFGRWGNYFNQELYGKPTDRPWGIPIDLENRISGFEQHEFFHPTFLYESFLNVISFCILFFLLRRKIEFSKLGQKEPDGKIFFVYLIFYACIRIFMEYFRIDETPEFFGIRLPIIVSLGIIFIVGAVWFQKWFKMEKI